MTSHLPGQIYHATTSGGSHLTAFTVNQRRKEVGIRKVLGASIASLLVLFSRQYVFLIGAASLIAIPAIQYGLNLWLESFAYRIEISWWIYLLSALANPVNVLRDE